MGVKKLSIIEALEQDQTLNKDDILRLTPMVQTLANENIVTEDKVKQINVVYEGYKTWIEEAEEDIFSKTSNKNIVTEERFLNAYCNIAEHYIGEGKMPYWWRSMKLRTSVI